jgi:uncharacterized protein YjdB
MKVHHFLAASVLALGLAGCGGILPTACTDELGIEVEPEQRTIRVGETVQARAFGVTCGGRKRSPYTVAWRTANAGIVSVDPQSGVITGLAPGTATVTAHEPEVSADWDVGRVAVQVVPQ